MQFFKLTSSMAFLSFIVGLAACSEGDQGTGRLAEMRCAQNGLCVEKVGIKSIEIGYREGNNEVRADAIYRRNGVLLGSDRPYSTRFVDQEGKVFSLGNSGSNPDGWHAGDTIFGQGGPELERDVEQYLDSRRKLLQSMADSMRRQGCPANADAEAWQEIEEQLIGILKNDEPR